MLLGPLSAETTWLCAHAGLQDSYMPRKLVARKRRWHCLRPWMNGSGNADVIAGVKISRAPARDGLARSRPPPGVSVSVSELQQAMQRTAVPVCSGYCRRFFYQWTSANAHPVLKQIQKPGSDIDQTMALYIKSSELMSSDAPLYKALKSYNTRLPLVMAV